MSWLDYFFSDEESQRSLEKIAEAMREDRQARDEEVRRQLDAAGFYPERMTAYRLVESNKPLSQVGVVVIDCPTCMALVRVDAFRDHTRWHDREA